MRTPHQVGIAEIGVGHYERPSTSEPRLGEFASAVGAWKAVGARAAQRSWSRRTEQRLALLKDRR